MRRPIPVPSPQLWGIVVVEALVAFGSALGGAAAGAWLGHLLARRAQRDDRLEERRRERAERLFDVAERATVKALEAMQFRRAGQEARATLFELGGFQHMYENRLRLIAADHRTQGWGRVQKYSEAPPDLLGSVVSWNHVADDEGYSVKSAAAVMSSLAMWIVMAEGGDEVALRELRSGEPILSGLADA